MSQESAKAFCVRMMSDDSFRDRIGSAATAQAITDIVKGEKYDFNQSELRKVVGELLGKKIDPEQLTAMVCEVYESEIKSKGGSGSAEAVAGWLASME